MSKLIKHKESSGFTTIFNSVIQSSISIEAKGAFVYMQSLPDNWDFSAVRIANCLGCSYDKCKRIMNELIECGLVEREYYHNELGHKKANYVIRDTFPAGKEHYIEKPYKEKPSKEIPYKGKPHYNKINNIINKQVTKEINNKDRDFEENKFSSQSLGQNSILTESALSQSQSNATPLEAIKHSQSTHETKRGRQGSDALFEAMPKLSNKQYSEQFDEFWKIYPRKVSKQVAYKAYLKALKETSHEKLVESINKQIEIWKVINTPITYMPHCATWLNEHRYSDDFNEILETCKQHSSDSSKRISNADSKKVEIRRFTRDMEAEHIRLYGDGAIDFFEMLRIDEENKRQNNKSQKD